MKKKKKVNIYKNDNRRFLLVLAMVISIVISMFFYWIYAYYHKYGSLPSYDNIMHFNADYYVKVKGDMVYIENISDDINNDFLERQKNYSDKEIMDVDIAKGIYDNILSVKIKYLIHEEPVDYEDVVSLNIDLFEKKVISNEELLKKIDVSYKEIAESIFDDYIKVDDIREKVTDAITEEEMTGEEFNKLKEKYIIRIREKLPQIMNMYIEDDKVYGSFNLMEINKVCYYVNNDMIINVYKELGKI